MSKLSTFNEHFQKTITLRNELVPVGKTLENIISSNVLINDVKRSEDYKKAKDLIDSYHRIFIEKSLSKVDIVWDDLAFCLTKKEPEDFDKKNKYQQEINKLQNEKRKKIAGIFKKFSFGVFYDDKGKESKIKFDDLFKSTLFKYVLPNFLKNDEDKTVVRDFSEFTS